MVLAVKDGRPHAYDWVPGDDAILQHLPYALFDGGQEDTGDGAADNLIGKLEGWGIGPATPVAAVSIRVATASGAQLKELLKKLPDGMTFELSLEKEDTR